MRNKIYYIYIFIGLCVGAILTAWGYNAATAEREEKASSLCAHEWQNGVSAEDYEKHCRGKYTSSPIDLVEFKTCTRCGLIKMTHIESAEIPERSLQLDNQEEIDWTLFDTTEPNLMFAADPVDWTIVTDTVEVELSIQTANIFSKKPKNWR